MYSDLHACLGGPVRLLHASCTDWPVNRTPQSWQRCYTCIHNTPLLASLWLTVLYPYYRPIQESQEWEKNVANHMTYDPVDPDPCPFILAAPLMQSCWSTFIRILSLTCLLCGSPKLYNWSEFVILKMFNKLTYVANAQPGVPVGLKAGRKRTIPFSSTSSVPATRPRPGPNSGSPSTSVSKPTAASRDPTPGPEGNIRKTTVTAGQPSTSYSHTRLNVTPCDSNPAVCTMTSITGTGQAVAGRKYQKAWQVNSPPFKRL